MKDRPLWGRRARLGLLVFGVIWLAGCAGMFPTAAQALGEPPPAATQPAPEPMDPAPNLTAASAAYPAPTRPAASPQTPTEIPAAPAAPPPTPEVVVRQELAATDPTTVVLASGRVQLVEFFAFW